MKKIMFLAAVSMMSASAFASKARLSALQNSESVSNDFQDLFDKPNRMMTLSDQVTFEWGSPSLSYATGGTSGSSPNSEGGFLRSFGSSKMGAYIGRQSDNFTLLTSGGALAAVQSQIGTQWTTTTGRYLDNPFNIFYATKLGDMNFGASLYYANSSRRTSTQQSKNAQALIVGLSDDVWEVTSTLSLGAQVRDETTGTSTSGDQIKGDSGLRLAGHYKMGTTKYYADYSILSGTASTVAGNSSTKDGKLGISSYNLGMESFFKGEGSHFFYGVAYRAYSEAQTGASHQSNGSKYETARIPLILGVEAEASSWATVRGAVSQSILIDTEKVTSTGGSTTNSGMHDTTVTAGLGLKFQKMIIDAVLAAGSSGQLNANSFGTNASLTYMF
ncbi:MAG: hypothetical protein WCH11_01935 [Bdellovibrio sp.]